MKNKQLISYNIEKFYNKASEESRLEKGMGVFEFERIKSLIKRHIVSPKSKIIDVGGGTGKYSEWLAQMGHEVHLVEPVLKHVAIAQQRAKKYNGRFKVQQAEAQNIDIPNKFADLVILHGPLYHLQNASARAKAIAEAKRLVKKGGLVLGFAINRSASTLAGLLQGLIHKPEFFKMCEEELATGIHNPPENFPWLLAEAYYHHPDALQKEFEDQGLLYLNMYAVEGMVWLDKDFFKSLQDPIRKATLVDLLHVTENDKGLLPFSPHMMIVAQKD